MFHFLVTDLTQYKATFDSDQLVAFRILTWTDNAFLGETIKRDNNKHYINSSLGTVNFLFGTVFDFGVNKFLTILLFFDDRT